MRTRRSVLQEVGNGLLVTAGVISFLFVVAVLLSSCARDEWYAPMVVKTDSTGLMLPALPAGKYKFTGPVNIVLQQGTGNVATPTATDNTKAGQRATAPAIGAGSTATATEKHTPWGWILAAVLVVLALGFWLRGRLTGMLSWLV